MGGFRIIRQGRTAVFGRGGAAGGQGPGGPLLATGTSEPRPARAPAGATWLRVATAAAAGTAWMLLQRPNFLSGYDLVRMHALYKAFYRDAWLSGQLPLWNPYVGLGRPFLADIETATLYPPSALVLVLGVTGGLVASVFLHQMLAIYGGQRWGRTLGAPAPAGWMLGLGLALSGPFTSRLSVGIIEGYFTLCWMPLLLALGSELQDAWSPRLAACFAAAVGLAILAGQPPLLFVVFLGVAVFLCVRHAGALAPSRTRSALGVLAASLVGVGLAAATLLPFLELVGQGNRPLEAPDFAVANGMPAPSWLSLVFPASRVFAPNWEYDVHCGWIPLLAAGLGVVQVRDRNVRALLAMGIAGALMAAGDHGPFLGWIVRVLPGSAALRIPSRYAILTAVSLFGLAAVGLGRPSRRGLWIVGLLGAACVGWILWLRPHLATDPHGQALWTAALCAAVILSAAGVLYWSAPSGRTGAGARGAVLVLCCVGNWAVSLELQAPVYSTYGFSTAEQSVGESLRQAGLLTRGSPPPRVAYSPRDLCENSGMAGGWSTYNSYVAPSLYRTWLYLHSAANLPVSSTDFILMPKAMGRANPGWDGMNLTASFDGRSRTLSIRSGADPRAYLTFGTRTVRDLREADALMAGGFDFHASALVEGATPLRPETHAGMAAGTAQLDGFSLNRVTVHTHSNAEAVLVLAEAWYPGWKATVDGHPVGSFPVNAWMRGAVVPAGDHEVAFSFRPAPLAWGVAASLASAAAILVGACWPWRRRGPAVA